VHASGDGSEHGEKNLAHGAYSNSFGRTMVGLTSAQEYAERRRVALPGGTGREFLNSPK
jgi:hypothetical protein